MFFPVTTRFPQLVGVKEIGIYVILYIDSNFSQSDISDDDFKNAMAEKVRGIRNISSGARITMAYAFEEAGQGHQVGHVGMAKLPRCPGRTIR
jgi:hypothetical protein